MVFKILTEAVESRPNGGNPRVGRAESVANFKDLWY